MRLPAIANSSFEGTNVLSQVFEGWKKTASKIASMNVRREYAVLVGVLGFCGGALVGYKLVTGHWPNPGRFDQALGGRISSIIQKTTAIYNKLFFSQFLESWIQEPGLSDSVRKARKEFGRGIKIKEKELCYKQEKGVESAILPEFLVECNHVEKLTLHYDVESPGSLPCCIQNFSKLQELTIIGSDLEEIPGWVAKLKNLKTLKIIDSNLTKFPVHLKKMPNLRHLDLSKNSIEIIPEFTDAFQNLDYLILDNNPFIDLPDEFFTLPPACSVSLQGVTLTYQMYEVILYQRGVYSDGYIGPRMYFCPFENQDLFNQDVSLYNLENSMFLCMGFARSLALRTIKDKNALDQIAVFANKFNLEAPSLDAHTEGQKEILKSWLATVVDMAVFQKDDLVKQKYVIEQVFRYLNYSNQNEKFRDLMYPEMQQGMTACGDNTTWSLISIGIIHALSTLDFNDPKKAIQLFRNTFWTAQLIQERVEDKLAGLTARKDELETYLDYFLKLKEPLAMQIPFTEMRYKRISKATDADIANAEELILETRNDNEAFARFLCTQELGHGDSWQEPGREYWMKLLREHKPEELEELEGARATLAPSELTKDQGVIDFFAEDRRKFEQGLIALTKEILSS